MIRITGNVAITLAGQKGLTLAHEAGPWGPARTELHASDAELLASEAQAVVWLDVTPGDYAQYLVAEALENLAEAGDAVRLTLWDDRTVIEVAYHSFQELAVRDHQGDRHGEWTLLRSEAQLLAHIAELVDRMVLQPV